MFHLKQVTLYGAETPRLIDISLSIPFGRTAIVGYSGAGKTSLLNILAGFEQPDAGKVTRSETAAASGGRTSVPVADTDATKSERPYAGRAASTGGLPLYWVPQHGGLWPHLTVEQHLVCANEVGKLTDEILRQLDLASRRRAFPAELSQGERGRLALARALATEAAILLMDEPLSHVDPIRKPAYWNFVEEMVSSRGCSMVFSTHEPETILRRSEFVICLHDGRVAFQGNTRELYDDPADRFAGEFLGPLNWFDGRAQAVYLNHKQPDRGSAGIRPERLMVVCCDDSELEFERMLFQGAYAESLIKDKTSGETRTILHLRMSQVPEPGQKICLKVVH